MNRNTAQIRGARGILNWSQTDLAEQTGISTTSIGAIENGHTKPRENTIRKIQEVFETAGIEFIDGGVRVRNNNIKVFQGRARFADFYEDIHKTLSKNPGPVYVSNADERKFERWLGADNVQLHIERMQNIAGITYEILIQEGDNYTLASSSYAKYRWQPKELFSSIPFYIYGDKLAIIIFDNEPTVIVLNYPVIASAYKKQFEGIWNISTPVD